MGKKESRKKQLKKQQHDKKIIPFRQSQPYQMTFDFEDGWEDSKIEAQLDAISEESPDALFSLLADLLKESERDLGTDGFNQMKQDMGLDTAEFEYIQAMIEPDVSKRSQKFAELAIRFPNDYNIKLQHLIEREDLQAPDYFSEVSEFAKVTCEQWRKDNFIVHQEEYSPDYLEGCRFSIFYFLLTGFYSKAIELGEFISEHLAPERDFDIELMLMVAYTACFESEKLDYLVQDGEWMAEPAVIVQLMIRDLLVGDFSSARLQFYTLAEQVPGIAEFFASSDWIEFFKTGQFISVNPIGNVETIMDTLQLNYSQLATRPILQLTLTEFAKEFLQTKKPLATPPKEIRTLAQGLDVMAGAFALLKDSRMDGVRYDVARALYKKGIKTVDDFKKKTEKQILAIKGIGPATLKKLKTNGVVFKDTK